MFIYKRHHIKIATHDISHIFYILSETHESSWNFYSKSWTIMASLNSSQLSNNLAQVQTVREALWPHIFSFCDPWAWRMLWNLASKEVCGGRKLNSWSFWLQCCKNGSRHDKWEGDNLKHGPFPCLPFEDFNKHQLFWAKSGSQLPNVSDLDCLSLIIWNHKGQFGEVSCSDSRAAGRQTHRL